MSRENQNSEPFVDRRACNSGITSGGRRKADRRLFGPAGKKAKIGFAVSCVLSAGILAWAFTLPFRHDNDMVTLDGENARQTNLDVRQVSRSSDNYSNEEYTQWMMSLEEDLKFELAEKERQPKDVPDSVDAKANWKSGLKRRVQQVKGLTEAADGEIRKGTIEWDAQQELRAYLKDAPR